MNATFALARAELTLLLRNRTAATNALLLPLALGALFIVRPPPTGLTGTAASMLLLALVCLTVASTATTTLVARRQQHLLQRWRTAPVAPPAVLVSTLSPVGVLFAGQAAALLTVLAYATSSIPAHPVLLVLAVVLAGALGCAVAFVTAAFTRTVEATNFTLLPVLVALAGGGVWATAAAGEVTWAMRATGGGAVAELVHLGWGGSETRALTAAAPSVLVLLALIVGTTLLARRYFRWEPRN
ncbi:ABC-2 type transport system permease protein [Prauserella aidingensis]|uniref:hypothetical protein n=1 Tax=Prauserella aidingensis TaxID=387890 RepID=UPI0020A3202D|nr:hypothetical protein [Prauserella aidingensis]MCP2251711.1 ABC-2 type transport system permease protein [Prauserella aidingensis]